MKRILTILITSYCCFLAEIALFNNFGAWGKPELLILVVVFFTLYLGIRYGIVTAVIAGLLRDGMSISPAGTYLFTYLCVAYMITYIRRFIYQPGSRFSRIVMAFFGIIVAIIVRLTVVSSPQDYELNDLFIDILAPQLVTTVIAATFIFNYLRQMSERLRLK